VRNKVMKLSAQGHTDAETDEGKESTAALPAVSCLSKAFE
jgi:hypothetical protein